MNIVITKEWGQKEADAVRDSAKQDMAWWLRDYYKIPLPIGVAHMDALRRDFQEVLDAETPLWGDEYGSDRDRLLFCFVQDVLETKGLREVLGFQGPGGGKLPARIMSNRTVGVTVTTDKADLTGVKQRLSNQTVLANKRLKKYGLKAVVTYEKI